MMNQVLVFVEMDISPLMDKLLVQNVMLPVLLVPMPQNVVLNVLNSEPTFHSLTSTLVIMFVHVTSDITKPQKENVLSVTTNVLLVKSIKITV
jgi:hypothetical protein